MGRASDSSSNTYSSETTRAGVGPTGSHIRSCHAIVGLEAGTLKAKPIANQLAGFTAGVVARMYDAIGTALHSAGQFDGAEALVFVTFSAEAILGGVVLSHAGFNSGAMV